MDLCSFTRFPFDVDAGVFAIFGKCDDGAVLIEYANPLPNDSNRIAVLVPPVVRVIAPVRNPRR